MDNQLYGLPTQQACESAPKIQEMQEIKEQNEHKECALRFRMLSVGCFFYALFYTFCLYHNKSGITYPFFIGGTLYFFCFYLKKFGATAARDRRFLMGSMILLGIINCTTDSWVLISLNRLFITVLIGVWLLESFHESFAWRLGAWGRALMHLVFGSFTQIYKPVMDAYWSNKQRERKGKEALSRKCEKRGFGTEFLVLESAFRYCFLSFYCLEARMLYSMKCYVRHGIRYSLGVCRNF